LIELAGSRHESGGVARDEGLNQSAVALAVMQQRRVLEGSHRYLGSLRLDACAGIGKSWNGREFYSVEVRLRLQRKSEARIVGGIKYGGGTE
jgi:hypothetical protein